MELTGAALTFVFDAGYSKISWAATCRCDPEVKVTTGSGHLVRLGAGTAGIDLALKSDYVCAITGADTVYELAGSYWGLFGQLTMMGQGVSWVYARGAEGSMLTILPREFVDLRSFLTWLSSKGAEIATKPIGEETVEQLLAKYPNKVLMGIVEESGKLSKLPFTKRLDNLSRLAKLSKLITSTVSVVWATLSKSEDEEW
jgi:hypothetical protein